MAKQQGQPTLEIGSRISLTDAAQLPDGAWVSFEDGLLYEAQSGHSLTSVLSRQPVEYIKVGEPEQTPFTQMRTRAREADIQPQF